MKILNRLPYADAPTSETVGEEGVRIKPYQIIVWVSVSIRQIVEWDQRTRNALRRQCLENEFQHGGAASRIPRKIRRLWEHLLKLVA
jgi:hypothetical protein